MSWPHRPLPQPLSRTRAREVNGLPLGVGAGR